MIDTKIIKDDPDRVRAELEKRGVKLKVSSDAVLQPGVLAQPYVEKEVSFDRFLEIDKSRRLLQQSLEKLKVRQKKTTDRTEAKQIKEVLKKETAKYVESQQLFQHLLDQLPNFSKADIPQKQDEVIQTPKKKPTITNAKPHYEIPGIKPLIDFKRGAEVSGNRFWFLKGALVQLEFALIRYALDFYEKQGFVAMRPPTIVKNHAMWGSGFLPAERNEVYGVVDANVGEALTPEHIALLSGTAEVPLAAYHAGETLPPADLPIKYIGFAPAYRREAGSYGQDTKGILRGHEFDKLELFVFSAPDKSSQQHEELQTHAEEFWTSLNIPFQVVNICTGDLAAPNAKKIDVEAWLPGEGRYREVASNSNDTDFQARRLKIKSNGQLVHTLNNTACAIGRTIVAIVENYQRDDGSVDMPEVLHPYLPFKKITEKGEPA